MKKIIALFCVGSFLVATTPTAIAQVGATIVYNTNNLTPELSKIVENVKTTCSLNADQYKKFKSDYVLFLNENAKPNANTNGLLFLLGVKLRGYLNNDQFTKVSQLIKDGKLNPSSTTKLSIPATAPEKGPVSVTGIGTIVSTSSNAAELFQQLTSYMKITPEKAALVIPILKDYDQQVSKIKKENLGNAGKIKQLTDAVNSQIVPKLKMQMTDQQLTTLVVALGLQENILSGKNLSADQKQFLDKIRNQYHLNDAQTMSVILVLVQGKVRGDAIVAMNASNLQQAGKDFITLMQDLDGQLKSSLNNDQYIRVKSDIEKLIKGQKI